MTRDRAGADPHQGLLQSSRLRQHRSTFKDARRIDPWITREEVADFLRAQSIKQDLDKKRTFLATAAREQIDIDVAVFSNYGGVRYGLVAIDDFSKKLRVVPLGSRRGDDMVQALELVI